MHCADEFLKEIDLIRQIFVYTLPQDTLEMIKVGNTYKRGCEFMWLFVWQDE